MTGPEAACKGASIANCLGIMLSTRDTLLASSDEEVDMRAMDLHERMGTPRTRRTRQQGPGEAFMHLVYVLRIMRWQ